MKYKTILDIPIGKWTTARPKCSTMSHVWKKYDVCDDKPTNVARIGKNLTIICMSCQKCNTPKIKVMERSQTDKLVNLIVLYGQLLS